MSENQTVFDRLRLIELLQTAPDSKATRRALDLVLAMTALHLPVGRSVASQFIQLMNRKLRTAAEAGTEFDGWAELKMSLQSLDPVTAIRGVALSDGGSIVMAADHETVLGCLVRAAGRPFAEDE